MKKRTKEEGVKRMPLPEKRTLNVKGVQHVHNIGGAPDEWWRSTSPASPRYTVGLRKAP